MGMGLDSNLEETLSLLVASLYLHAEPPTLRRWIRERKIEARRILVSGRSYKLVISKKEIARYIRDNWPTLDDLELPPRSERAARIKKIITAKRRFLEKASAAKAARRYGRVR